jgi:hypothetical protein
MYKHSALYNYAIVMLCLSIGYKPSLCSAAETVAPKHAPLIFTEYPSTLRIPSCKIRDDCRGGYATFSVSLSALPGSKVSSALVRTAGLANARLFNVKQERSCPRAEAVLTDYLEVTDLDKQPAQLCVYVPLYLIPEAGMSIKGDLLALVPNFETVTSRIEIQRPPDPTRTAFLWFLGIAVPGLLGFWLNGVGTRWAGVIGGRRAQIDAFEVHKHSERDSFRRFFTDYLPTLAARSHAEFVRGIRLELMRQGSWQLIPARERRELDNLSRRLSPSKSNAERFVAVLSDQFSEWRDLIKGPQP